MNHGIPVYIPVGTFEAYQNAPNWSEFTNFIELPGVGVAEHEGTAAVAVYPNPTTDLVRIEGIESAEVQVCNALGQLVKTVRDANEINVAGLPEGVYLLRIADAEGNIYTNKITVR